MKNYYYPLLCNSNKNTKKVQTAIYIRSDFVHTIPISSTVTNALEEIYATIAMVKINKQTTLNVISVYFPNEPKGDNKDWRKDIALSNKSCVIVGDFNAHAPFWENGCTSVTCNRLVENIVDSSLCLLNDGRITRIPYLSTHKATAIDLSLITPDLAVNCTWYTEEDCLGSDHLPIIIELNENIKGEEREDEDKIPNFQYKHADWEAYQAFLLSSDINSIINEDIDMYYSNFTKTILLAPEQSIPRIKHKKIREQSGNPLGNTFCKQAVSPKREKFKKWINNKIEGKKLSMKSAKIQCNRVISEAKKYYWTEFCKSEVLESKDM